MAKVKILFSLISLLVLLQAAPAFAERGSSTIKNRFATASSERQERLEDLKDKIASRSALRKEKLEATKLQICQTRQEFIKRRSDAIAKRAETHITNFTRIEEKVEKFYTDKMLPKGITVSNYDVLKSVITTKKTAVNDLLAVAKQDAANFSCTGEDPKGQLKNFKADMQAIIKALKEYRTSIKDLIVAVRTAFNNSENGATDSAKQGTSSAGTQD